MDEKKKEGEEKKEEEIPEEKKDKPEAQEDKPGEHIHHIKTEEGNASKNKGDFTNKLRKNPFILSTLVFGALAVLLLVVMVSGGMTGKVVSKEKAGNNLIEYLKTVVDGDVELEGVEDIGALYEATIKYNGNSIPIYVTKDGNSYTSNLIPLVAETNTPSPSQNTPSQQAQPQTTYTSEDLVKIKEFSQCLADNGVKAYGAGWCGYCKQFKEAFGGVEQITPFYYECQNEDRTPTENAQLCEEEQISGFPTIKINGERYSGARTIEGLASAVKACDAPELSGVTQQAQPQTAYTGDDLVKVSTFVDCLADKGVKIYGANWCGWTKKFVVETIGGFDIAAPIYVECTENEAECSAAEVNGYPTTKIKGEVYAGTRDFAGLAQATGCQAPDVEELVQAVSTTTTGNC